MTDQQITSSSIVTAQKMDDLKQINGIKSGIEHHLNAAGINTFSQLASMTPDELAQVLTEVPGLTAERITKKDWVGQARQLAAAVEGKETSHPITDSHPHYSFFTVHLLLDDNKNVKRTSVTHVQSQENSANDVWAGWDQERLFQFIKESAALHLPRYEDKWVPQATAPASIQSLPQSSDETISDSSMPDIQEKLKLSNVEIVTADLEGPQHLVQSGQPFNIKLMLDLASVRIPRTGSIHYSASIIARKRGSGEHRQIVGEATGEFLPTDRVIVDVDGLKLPVGLYHIEAFVNLNSPDQSVEPERGLMAMKEGGILQVY